MLYYCWSLVVTGRLVRYIGGKDEIDRCCIAFSFRRFDLFRESVRATVGRVYQTPVALGLRASLLFIQHFCGVVVVVVTFVSLIGMLHSDSCL